MKRFLKPEIIMVLAAAAISFCLLMPAPILGVADNGDFGRIMGSTGLEYLSENRDDRYFGYVNREYAMKDSTLLGGGYISSEIFLVEAAKLINKILVPGTDTFDIRFLAAIYICILLTAMYLMVRFSARILHSLALIPSVLLLFMFTDVGYISYFNSLYGEAVALTSLLLLTGILIYMSSQEVPKTAALSGFFAAALALSTAKIQYIPVGIVLAAYSVRLAFIRKDTRWKAAAISFSVFLLAASLISYFSIPDNIRVCNKY